MAIKRVWHGWTTPENAEAYQELLHRVVFPGIEAKGLSGYRCAELFRRDLGAEVEFLTILTFDSLDDVIAFNGKDYEKSYVPDAAQKLLKRWDQTAAHYSEEEKRSFRT
jgi:hypothetical protein